MNFLRDSIHNCQGFGQRAYDVCCTRAELNPANYNVEGTFEYQYSRLSRNCGIAVGSIVNLAFFTFVSWQALSSISRAKSLGEEEGITENQQLLLTGLRYTVYTTMTLSPLIAYGAAKKISEFANMPRGLIQNQQRENFLIDNRIELVSGLKEAIDESKINTQFDGHQKKIKSAATKIVIDDNSTEIEILPSQLEQIKSEYY